MLILIFGTWSSFQLSRETTNNIRKTLQADVTRTQHIVPPLNILYGLPWVEFLQCWGSVLLALKLEDKLHHKSVIYYSGYGLSMQNAL